MKKLFRFTIASLLFPLLLTLGVLSVLIAQHSQATALINGQINNQFSAELVAIIFVLGTMLLVHIAERLLPYRRDWNNNRGDIKTDITSLAMIIAILDPLIKITTLWASSLALSYIAQGTIISVFPQHWPILAQLALFIIATEFGRYWIHRASHTLPLLWRFHASHHSAERLYQFNGYRIHPINYLWNYFLGQFPLVLLGAGPDLIMLYFVFSSITAAFQHANIDSKNGILNYLLSTNELHRWHHSTDPSIGYKNHGSVVMLWDIIFGSYYLGGKRSLKNVGLMHPRSYPINSYIKQIAAPFCWQRCVTNKKSNRA